MVTIAALLMAALLPVSGRLTERFGPRRVYLVGIACYGLATFPAFALFGTKNLVLFGLAMIIVFGVIHALFYGAQGTLYSALYPTSTRYTGLSFVYQFSGIYASGVTPMILTALIAARRRCAVAGVRLSGCDRRHQRDRHRPDPRAGPAFLS